MAALPESDRRELELIPAGQFRMRPHDGRGPYFNRGAAGIIERSAAYSLVFDYDHQTMHTKENGVSAPASGWIKRLFERDGAVWGEVEWTEKARAAMDAKEYRYYSPVFLHDAAGNVSAIRSAALTNDPAMFVPALAHAETNDPERTDMDLEKLRKALGLAQDATEAQILAAASAAAAWRADVAKALGLAADATGEQAAAAATAAVGGMAQIAQAAGLEGTPAPDAIATAVAAARAGSAPDPTQFVPRSEFDRVSHRLTQIETEGVEARATAAVDKAIKAGKVTPAQREWALGYARKDMEGFEAYASAAPAILRHGAISSQPVPDAELTADELAVCQAMGVKPDDFKASRKSLIESGLMQVA